jgi:hypothetical protein
VEVIKNFFDNKKKLDACAVLIQNLKNDVLVCDIMYQEVVKKFVLLQRKHIGILGALASQNNGCIIVEKNVIDYFSSEGLLDVVVSEDDQGNLVVVVEGNTN